MNTILHELERLREILIDKVLNYRYRGEGMDYDTGFVNGLEAAISEVERRIDKHEERAR